MKIVALIGSVVLLLAQSANAAEYVIEMKFNEDTGKVFFSPEKLKVSAGDRVTWVQGDRDNGHNVVSYPDGIPKGAKLFESPMIQKYGGKWSMVFTRPGTYKYHCHPHEQIGMKGMIVVDRESRPGEFRKARRGEHMHEGDGHGDGGHAKGGHMNKAGGHMRISGGQHGGGHKNDEHKH